MAAGWIPASWLAVGDGDEQEQEPTSVYKLSSPGKDT